MCLLTAPTHAGARQCGNKCTGDRRAGTLRASKDQHFASGAPSASLYKRRSPGLISEDGETDEKGKWNLAK